MTCEFEMLCFFNMQAVYEQRVKEVAMAVPLLCCAFDLYNLASKRQVIVAGTRNSGDTEALMTACHANFDPDKTVSSHAPLIGLREMFVLFNVRVTFTMFPIESLFSTVSCEEA